VISIAFLLRARICSACCTSFRELELKLLVCFRVASLRRNVQIDYSTASRLGASGILIMMAYELIDGAPKISDFTALSEHQEQTPGSVFAGKPVLHLHCPHAKVKISNEDLTSQPDFARLLGSDGAANAITAGDVVASDIYVWVTSRCGRLPLHCLTPGRRLILVYKTSYALLQLQGTGHKDTIPDHNDPRARRVCRSART